MNNKVYDISGKKKIWFLISLVLIAAIIVVSVVKGVEIAIEFKGGTIISYSYEGDVQIKDVQSDIEELLNTPVTIQEGENLSSDSNSVSISFSYDNGLTAEGQNELTALLQEKFPDNNIEVLDSNDVNPTSGKEFFIKCIIASALAAIIIILYIAFRFKQISGWSAGVCAVIALIHNLIFVFGTFVVLGYEINSNFIAVILTILGYSVNDTIVVYDRIRENKSIMPKASVAELVNVSASQSLRRSIRTSVTTVSTMLIVSIVAYIYHVNSILSFSIPMIVGMVAGTYASLCIASPLWVWWNERKSKKKAAK
ncbi:protein translocase subunit SecF [Porcipelethomonas sp.]|uniref:protein translocase subunit SecF n=1 Tax=Porcipelethomonas sp. TaxID=2981675 RepID=UPI003EF8FC6C